MEWTPYNGLSDEDYAKVRSNVHVAIQNIAAIGRVYLPKSEEDQNAVLTWIPGYWRFAGMWIDGNKKFRSSISLKDFNIYLVDRTVKVLSQYPLFEKTHRQVMVWLEEQILSLGLGSKEITLDMPYEIKELKKAPKYKFEKLPVALFYEFGKIYHNTQNVLLRLEKHFPNPSAINIWPEKCNISLSFTLKDTGELATNTRLFAGLSPGDEYFDKPYFYVSTIPFVEVEEFEGLSKGLWYSEDWTGAILNYSKAEEQENPAQFVLDFYIESLTRLAKKLLR